MGRSATGRVWPRLSRRSDDFPHCAFQYVDQTSKTHTYVLSTCKARLGDSFWKGANRAAADDVVTAHSYAQRVGARQFGTEVGAPKAMHGVECELIPGELTC